MVLFSPVETSIQRLFEAQVEQTPDAIAITYEDQQLTYQALNTRANQLAHYLQHRGIGPESLVTLCTTRSLELVISLLAILKAGGAYVPLDPDAPNERLEFVLQETRAALLITQQEFLARFPAESQKKLLSVSTLWPLLALQEQSNPDPHLLPQNLAYVIYTSGSTGRPKGALVSHGNVLRLLQASQPWFQFGAQDVWTLFHSYTFDFSVWELWGALCSGGRLVVIPYLVSRSPQDFYQLLSREGVTVLNQTPSAFRQLMQAEEHSAEQLALALRYVIFGGEALEFQQMKPWFERHGDRRPRLINMYGITETTVHVTYRPLALQDALEPSGSVIGRPIPDWEEVYVLDSSLNLCPPGTIGEFYVGGAGLARGYLDHPELTAERFLANPFSQVEGTRMYRTGDLGRYLPSGELEYLGRADQQVKIRGFRIELGEIEVVLAQHPGVQDCVVFAREDTSGEKYLAAYFVARPASSPSPAALRQHLQQRLPDYMLPAAFVALEALPLTANGKLDRRALPAPERSRREVEEAYVPPQTTLEEMLVTIWSQVLGLEHIGIHDNFFALGGHSLLATQVITRLRTALQIDVPLPTFFAFPTIAELATRIAGARPFELLQEIPLQRVEKNARHPLTFSQELVWFLQQFDPESVAYQSRAMLHFSGPLDLSLVERCFREIFRRHDIFRTTFEVVDERPVQIIHADCPLELRVIDLQALAPAEQEAERERILAQELRKLFDLGRLPLIRWIVFRQAAQEHLLLHVEHHLIHDGWSFNNFFREFIVLYRACLAGEAAALPELPIQFVDFAHWQRQWVQSRNAEAQINYWKQALAGDPPPLRLPTDRPRPLVQTFQGSNVRVKLPAELCRLLRSRSRQEGSTLFMFMVTAFFILLYRYSGQEDITVGTGIANRRLPETEALIGMIINTIVLRASPAGSLTGRALLERIRQITLEAYAHQDLPFEKVVEVLRPTRYPGHSPLFQVMFSFHDSPSSQLELPETSLQITEVLDNGSAKFDINVIVIPRKEQLAGSGQGTLEDEITLVWEYNTDLFERQTAQRMVTHYQTVLESMVESLELPLSEMPMLTQAECQHLVVTCNETRTQYPEDQSLPRLFEAQVLRTPEAVAVSFAGASLTYRALEKQAEQLARYLQGHGIGPEALVGVCMERSLELVVALLGVLKAGGAYVPLDPEYPPARLAFLLADTQASVVLTQRHLRDRLPAEEPRIVCLDASEWEEQAAQDVPEELRRDIAAQNQAYVIYTSGSTGTPKGVVNTHLGLLNRLLWMQDRYQLTRQDRVLQKTPYSFDVSVWEFFWPLLTGASLVLAQPGGHRDSSYLAWLIREQQVSVLHFVPSMLQVFLEEEGIAACRSLRTVICSGEVLPPSLAERFFALLGAELHNLYGPTEAAIDVTAWECEHEAQRLSVPIGRPISNTQIYLLDQHLQPVPVGVPGELYIGGWGLARGYLHQPMLTAERFIPHPFSSEPGARLYKTGDLARYLPDGTIEYLERLDYQVKIRGFRIELGEIEFLLRQHPDLRDVVVQAREDCPGDKRLVAYLVAGRSRPDTSELRQFLQAQLPSYMIPASFVFLEALPLTQSGKVDRQALPHPSQEYIPDEEDFVAPRTPVEEVVRNIWREILGKERLSINQNFFTLGGHSLQATQIMSRIQKMLRVELPLSTLFETPTIAGLASTIEKHPEGIQKQHVPAIKPLVRRPLNVQGHS